MIKRISISKTGNPELSRAMEKTGMSDLASQHSEALTSLMDHKSIVLKSPDTERNLDLVAVYASALNQPVTAVFPDRKSLEKARLTLNKSFKEEQIKVYGQETKKAMLKRRVKFLLLTVQDLNKKAISSVKGRGGLLLFERCMDSPDSENAKKRILYRRKFERAAKSMENHVCLFSTSPSSKTAIKRISRIRECRVVK